MRQGILFIGHGTRESTGIREFNFFATKVEARIRELAGENAKTCWFGSCFLELKAPTISESIRNAVDAGCQRIIAVPIFLFSARHIKSDIPRLLSSAKNGYPGLSITCLTPLGNRNALVETCVERIFESGYYPDMKQVCLVFVCRGGKDEEARREFRCVVQKIIDSLGHLAEFQSGRKEVYLAGEGPRLHEVLVTATNEGYEAAYVVPILLFQGQLTSDLKREVQEWNENGENHDLNVILTSHLGSHGSLITSVAVCSCHKIHMN
jgi:sirohydrochlorin ferrochelatase